MNATDAKQADAPTGSIVLFDGICGLCDFTVNFVMDHDPTGKIHFASLQSEKGRQLLSQYGLRSDAMDTMVLIDEGKAYFRSNAALRIGLLLGHWPAHLAEGLLIAPEALRDFVYRWIAKNRYRWFGKLDACRIPTANTAQRFL